MVARNSFTASRNVIYIDRYGVPVAHRREWKFVSRSTYSPDSFFRAARQRWNVLARSVKSKLKLK